MIGVDQEYLEWVGNKIKELTEHRALLRRALNAVEYIEEYPYDCPWCHEYKWTGHRDDCLRQIALYADEPEVKRTDYVETQLSTLFGDKVVIVGICGHCRSAMPETHAHKHFLDGLTVFCVNCNSPHIIENNQYILKGTIS